MGLGGRARVARGCSRSCRHSQRYRGRLCPRHPGHAGSAANALCRPGGEGDALADPSVWACALVAERAPGDDSVWPPALAAVAGATVDRADLAPDQADALADVESVFEVAAFVEHWAKGGHTVETGRL